MEGVTPVRSYSSDYNIARNAARKVEQGQPEDSGGEAPTKLAPETSFLLSAPADSRAESEQLVNALGQHQEPVSVKEAPVKLYDISLLSGEPKGRVDAGDVVSLYQHVASAVGEDKTSSTDKLV